ncbi:hypothetical protein DdX_04196 [Ditylenchus destructor]|uniref:Uncharacterized protein n=1 Tax=Ditylenchus destructor TaxID=166010 RepID=A0AAD4R7J2_9BILA|nr:hypothetical protein DdX_04196 [Ditylenchus destructor]
MGIFKLFDGNEDEAGQRRSVYKTFRSVLSLALIPPEHVRRAFMLIVGNAVPGLRTWLGYFAKNFVGLTQLEKDRGAAAFDPLRVFLRRSRSTERFTAPSPMATITTMMSRHSRRSSLRSTNTTLNATLPSRPSTLSSRSSFQLVQRWDMEIVQKPRYAIPFWKVFNRAQNALETNNGMESSHRYFAQVITVLAAANFDTDDGLIDAVNLLGLVMQGFVDGLRVPNEDQEENETSDEEF